MARSHAVWVVMDCFSWPQAAFTVKHELISWLEKQPPRKNLYVIRFPDNPARWPDQQPQELEISELIA